MKYISNHFQALNNRKYETEIAEWRKTRDEPYTHSRSGDGFWSGHRKVEPKKNLTELQRHRLKFGADKAAGACDQSRGGERVNQKRSSEVCIVLSHDFLSEV